jgi:hypothetical protein
MILAYKGVDFRYAFFIVSIWIYKCLELHTCILFKHITKVSTASKHPIRNIFIFLHLLKKWNFVLCVFFITNWKKYYTFLGTCVCVFSFAKHCTFISFPNQKLHYLTSPCVFLKQEAIVHAYTLPGSSTRYTLLFSTCLFTCYILLI